MSEARFHLPNYILFRVRPRCVAIHLSARILSRNYRIDPWSIVNHRPFYGELILVPIGHH